MTPLHQAECVHYESWENTFFIVDNFNKIIIQGKYLTDILFYFALRMPLVGRGFIMYN